MTLKTRLLLFIPLVVLGTGLAIGLLSYGRTAVEVQQDRRDSIAALESRTGEIHRLFLELRRAEKDFLLQRDQAHVARHAASAEDLRGRLAGMPDRIVGLGDALDAADYENIEAGLDDYLAAFRKLVATNVTLGLDEDSGLEGALRGAVHGAENMLDGLVQPELLVKMLMMRRHEKDFMMRVDQKYIDRLAARVAEFKAFPAEMFGGPAARAELTGRIDAYRDAFGAFAAATLDERELRDAVPVAYARIEELLAQAETAVDDAKARALTTIAQTRQRIRVLVYAAVGVATLLIAAMAALTATSVSRTLRATASAMSRLAGGDEAVEVPGLDRRDEIGDIARAFQGVQKLTAERDRRARAAEQASLEEQRTREAAEHMRAREEAERREAERRQLDLTVGLLAKGLERLSAGDLGHRIETPFTDELEHLRHSFNTVMVRLQETIGVVDSAARKVLAGSQDIRGSAETLSNQAISQAASLEETAATMEEISETVKTNARSAASVSRLAVETRGQAEQGRTIVADTVQAMSGIRASASEIGEIVRTIDGIAFQTNLLALNAAVEAARAGDAGKGFAVVASEVRTLAQRSGEAAKTINALISKSTAQVAEGDRLVGATDKALSEILDGVREVAATIENIASASREQTTGVEEVSSTVSRMDEVTQQTAGMADRSASAARLLAEQSQKLVALVAAFGTGQPRPTDAGLADAPEAA